jgi:cytoplasmic iron level regulating protein YaaA (DUF328/UPF0246 family)
MKIVLIACCQTKKQGGDLHYKPSAALTSILSTRKLDRLMEARRELANMLKLDRGPDLGFGNGNSKIKYLPAYIRYAGNVYSSAEISELYPKAKLICLTVISALYGLLDGNDLIRDYDLAMDETLPNGTKAKTWWKLRDLGSIVEEYIRGVKPKLVHDFLSGHYRDALQPWPPNSIYAQVKNHEYPGQGSGSSWSRGKEIKALLESNIDN